jgi:hypothetical protein
MKSTIFLVIVVLCLRVSSFYLNGKSSHFLKEFNNPTYSNFMEVISQEPNSGNEIKSNSLKKELSSPLPMENNGYLFYGYNIFFGNPHDTEGSIDPGFTHPIFHTSYKENILTGDLRFKIPDGSIFAKNVGCDASLSSSSFKDSSSYRKSLEAEINVEGNFWFASFSANASFKSVIDGTSSSENMYVESKADCRVFSGNIDYYRPPLLHSSFVKAIEFIGQKDFKDDKKEYFKFIDYFGTHFINELKMGARLGYLEKTTVTEYYSGKFLSAGASLSVSSPWVSASAKVSGSSDDKTSGSNGKKDVKTFSIGASPDADGNTLKWAEKAILEPMPIKYSLRTILEIFTHPLFNLDQLKTKDSKVDLSKFIKNLESAYEAYCSEHLLPNGKTSFCDEKGFLKLPNDKKKPFPIRDGAIVNFKNASNQKCLTFKGLYANLTMETCGSSGQFWKLQRIRDGPQFSISLDTTSSLIAMIDGQSSNDTTKTFIKVNPLHNGVSLNQSWGFQPNNDLTYGIVNSYFNCIGFNHLIPGPFLEFKNCQSDLTSRWIITEK